MGFDKMLSFFNKNLPNICDELYDKPYIIANHIMIDINFILYNSINELETQINYIIKLICGIPYTDANIIETNMKKIFIEPHWDLLNLTMEEIMDGNSINEIIKKFKQCVDDNIIKILQIHLYLCVVKYIETTHVKEFIKSINIFFDGIPAYSKILEQRRRRMKTYLDSKNRKQLLKKNINTENIHNGIINEFNILYDYNEWVNSLYSIDIMLGPYSKCTFDIANNLEIKLTKYFENIYVYICNSTINGEADFKIFKYIHDNTLDCDITIHSCDSDFIFMAVWYQVTSIVKHKNININYINHIGNVKQLYCAKKIVDSLLDKYKYINNIIDDVSINIVFDTLSIILLFGNDIMPISYELGCELSLKQLYETHYVLYCVNKFIVSLNNVNIICMENLVEWLTLIKQNNSFSTIILTRFYKLPFNIINNCVENNKTFEEVVRSNIVNDTTMKNTKGFSLENNTYQSYYNYICNVASTMTNDIFNRPFKIFYEHFNEADSKYIEITKNKNTRSYLFFYVSLCMIFFYNFDLYSPFNLVYYDDILAPSISMIVDYINNNNMSKLINECYIILNTPVTEYFNPISHHIFITPYILEYHVDGIEMRHLETLLNMIEVKINGIWYKENKFFNLKTINPSEFIVFSNNLIKFYKHFYNEKFNKNKTSITYNVN